MLFLIIAVWMLPGELARRLEGPAPDSPLPGESKGPGPNHLPAVLLALVLTLISAGVVFILCLNF